MVANEAAWGLFMGGVEGATRELAAVGMKALNALPIPWVEAENVSKRRPLPGLRRVAVRHRDDNSDPRRRHAAVQDSAPGLTGPSSTGHLTAVGLTGAPTAPVTGSGAAVSQNS